MMDILLSFSSECLEVIKIYLLLHYMTNACEQKHPRRWLITLGLIVAKTTCNLLYNDNLVSCSIMVFMVVAALFQNKWFENLIWASWSLLVIGFIDYFWRILIQFILETTGRPDHSLLAIHYGLATILVIFALGKIYIYVNHGRFTLPLGYYLFFSGTALVNGVLIAVYTDGIKTQYTNTDTPLNAILCVTICAAGFLTEMLAILILGATHYLHKETEQLQKEMLYSQQAHYTELELRETDTRQFRHDISDHIFTVKELMSQKKYEDAFTYIVNMADIMDSLKTIQVGRNAADALLSYYLTIANSQKLELEITGSLPQELHFTDCDLCMILSNILRNAISASQNRPGTIYLQFRYDEEYVYISERNSCDDNLIIENTFPTTSKIDKKNHGYGLKNIKQVVDKNGGILTIQAQYGEFQLQIALRNKEVSK